MSRLLLLLSVVLLKCKSKIFLFSIFKYFLHSRKKVKVIQTSYTYNM